jgi:tetratricopeptide (TPR) repeat protein
MKLTKKTKIVIIVVAVVIILGGLLAWQTWRWQGSLSNIKNYVANLFSGEKKESLPANIQAAYDAIKNDPTNTDAYMTLALWKRDQGNLDDAIKLYEAALQVKPNDTLLLMNSADLYIRNKQNAEAAGAYLKVVESNPKWLAAYRSLADLYRYQMPERHEEIPSILQKGLDANPDNELYFVGPLAIYYKDFGPKDEAIKWYERLLELDPTNATAKEELDQLKK